MSTKVPEKTLENKIHTLRESEFVILGTLLQCLVEELVKTIGSNTLVVGLNVFLECRTAEREEKMSR